MGEVSVRRAPSNVLPAPLHRALALLFPVTGISYFFSTRSLLMMYSREKKKTPHKKEGNTIPRDFDSAYSPMPTCSTIPSLGQVALPSDLAWVPALVRSDYFVPCPNHPSTTGAGGGVAKGELTNLFCLSTRESLCSACAARRSSDDVIQVRESPHFFPESPPHIR